MAIQSAGTRNIGPNTERLAHLIVESTSAKLDSSTWQAAKTFLADTLSVGVAGKCNDASEKILAMAQGWEADQRGTCRVLGRPGVRLSSHGAAVVNGFQIHCLEWDALHEQSVVIALCVTTAAILSEVETGRSRLDDVLLAMTIGVETAVFFGAAATTEPRFFRPSVAGVMGAVAALGKLRGFDQAQMIDALGIAYSQASGTMQAHWEGSEMLALQVGIAARSALTAADAVTAGLTGPHDVIDGKFGYFQLIETNEVPGNQLEQWGAPWKITEIAHKPFPAGRATQATLTALMDMQAQAAFAMDDVELLTVHVPSLIMLLVGRPYFPQMSPAYARLCLEWVAPQMIRHGKVDPARFTPACFAKREAADDAARIVIKLDKNPDPNALAPQRIELRLKDGRCFEQHVEVPFGSPLRPLSQDQQLDKARACFAAGHLDRDPQDLFDAIAGPDDTDMGRIISTVCDEKDI